MKLLVVGVLAVILTALLTIALLTGYQRDQQMIRWFPGTGIAAKVDVAGGTPAFVVITNARSGEEYTFQVLDDGTFVAPLPPGMYGVQLPNDDRTVTLAVPNGECLDLVLDFRFPIEVLKVPREGAPLPQLA